MSEEKYSDSEDRIEIEVTEPTPVPPGTRIPDAVEKGEDFSSDAEPLEEVQLPEEPREQSRIAELEDKLLRMAAEFDNYRKRTNRQFDELARSANDRLLAEILEVNDNFERAREHFANDADPKSLRKGMDLIFNQLQSLLKKNEIEQIEAVGKPFDPNLHEAVMQVDSKEYPEGIVAVEVGKGYRQETSVLRHSKVGVSKGKAK